MANMSYCRFTNTSKDLMDCLRALDDGYELSDFEIRAGKGMFESFLGFCADMGIIEDFDMDAVNGMFDDLSEDNEEDDE